MRSGVITVLSFCIFLTACGGGSSGGSGCIGDCTEVPTGPCSNPITLTAFDPNTPFGIGTSGNDYVLNVIGSGVLVLVNGSGVACEINIEGHNNLVRFETTEHTVLTCRISGNDNTIERPTSMGLTCEDTGLGNALIVY